MVASVVMIVATMTYLRVVHRWDPLSALMGASPGSMIQVIALSSELGADLRAIAIVQTMRVLLLTIGIPGGLALCLDWSRRQYRSPAVRPACRRCRKC